MFPIQGEFEKHSIEGGLIRKGSLQTADEGSASNNTVRDNITLDTLVKI